MNSGGVFDLDEKSGRLDELDKIASGPGFWDDPGNAGKVERERAAIDRLLNKVKEVEAKLEDVEVLLQLGEEEKDESLGKEAEDTLREITSSIRALELERMLKGEEDQSNAIVSVNSGAGGVDAQDWAEMLLRMFLRYSDRKGFKTVMLDLQPGDEAGIKSATFSAEGEYAYGYLKADIGVHRLVRISPFDANHRRHTSFASMAAYPEVDDNVEIEINEKDLRIDTFRAGGAGGQHVNKTDSAVRITHLPTGIVVQCQNERSQYKNKAFAMKVLKARLYDRILQERAAKAEEEHAQKKKIEWGSQIRSYVLHPYRMVKDLRTGLQTGNVDAVLDGDIEEFIETYLLKFSE